MTTATTLLLQGPLDGKGRVQLALVLLEGGRPAGGYRGANSLTPEEAQTLLASPAWRARP